MLSHTIKNVYLAQHQIDFRKRLPGLLAEAYFLELDIYGGDCLVFVHHSRTKLRVLCGDAYGSWILERFFEAGKLEQRFKFMTVPAFYEITTAELGMMLEGNAYIVEKSAKKWRK